MVFSTDHRPPTTEPSMALPIRVRASDKKRFTAEEEICLAQQIRDREDRIEELLLEVPFTADIMNQRTNRKELTSSRHVDRMCQAVAAVKRLRPRPVSALEVMGLWVETEADRWKLAMSGFRIAVGEARKMGGRGLDHEDLVNEGIMGLLDAAKRFDPARKLRFSTYARWWVRARMMRAIDTTGSIVRLPGGLLEKVRRVQMLKANLEKEFGDWDEQVLSDQIGMSVDDVRQILATSEETQVVSLVAPTNEDGNRSRMLEEMLSDESSVPADRLSEWAEMYDALVRVVSGLPEHHRRVVSLYLGLDNSDLATTPWTLQSAADQIGISRERVRQLLLNVRDRVWAELSSPDGQIPDLSIPDDQVLDAIGDGACPSREVAVRLFGHSVKSDHLRAVEETLGRLEARGAVEKEGRKEGRRSVASGLWSLRRRAG